MFSALDITERNEETRQLGIIVGSSVGGVVLIAALLVFLTCCVCLIVNSHKQKQHKRELANKKKMHSEELETMKVIATTMMLNPPKDPTVLPKVTEMDKYLNDLRKLIPEQRNKRGVADSGDQHNERVVADSGDQHNKRVVADSGDEIQKKLSDFFTEMLTS